METPRFSGFWDIPCGLQNGFFRGIHEMRMKVLVAEALAWLNFDDLEYPEEA
jgi:hypothetical protein